MRFARTKSEALGTAITVLVVLVADGFATSALPFAVLAPAFVLPAVWARNRDGADDAVTTQFLVLADARPIAKHAAVLAPSVHTYAGSALLAVGLGIPVCAWVAHQTAVRTDSFVVLTAPFLAVRSAP